MTDRDGWLERFDADDRPSPLVYWLAVGCIIPGAVGTLWSLPIPGEFYEISPLFNWGSAFLMVTAVYYFIISLSLAIGLLPFLVGLAAFELWLAAATTVAFETSISLFTIGIGGLWLAHRRRGGLRSMLGDLQHVMLAPAWALASLYRWLGIPV
jgi:hypothetical protein